MRTTPIRPVRAARSRCAPRRRRAVLREAIGLLLLAAFSVGVLGAPAPTRAQEPVSTPNAAAEAGAGDAVGDAAAGTGDRAAPTVDALMRHLDDLYRSSSSEATVTMEIVTADYQRTLVMQSWTRGQDDALIVVQSPAREAGTATLRTREGLWNYAPRADRLMRIPSGLMSEGWMGSHLSNDDLVRQTSYAADFTTTIEAVDEAGGARLRARSIPHERTAVPYTRVDFFVDAATWTPVRTEFFDRDTLVRTMHYEDVRDVQGRRIPMTVRVVPADRPREFTRMSYDALALDVPVDANRFTQQALRRAAGRR